MFQTLTRLIRHRWLDHTDAARAIPPALAEQLRREAHDALAPFGEQALRLRELADLIVQREA